MRNAETLVIATNNRHKVEEFQELFRPWPNLKIVPASEFIRNADKLSSVEVFEHYRENAMAKARACNHGCHYPSLGDDSGLEVDALGGGPGPRSHRYALPVRGESQDQSNIKKLLKELQGVPAEKRTARFVCHVALVMEGTLLEAQGTLEGTLALEAAGNGGFGYDPVFIPAGQTRTLAELGAEFKNRISHRALAIRSLMEEIKAREIVLARP
jgi:XTP/dITP diphosphohydrolase